MSVTLNHITFDCADAERVAGFWSSVLDEPVDDGASADFATITSRKAASWMFVKVPEATIPQERVGKPPGQRIHVDLKVGDDQRDDEVERLTALGAVKLWDGEQDGTRWVTMADPEGNAFCIV